MVPEYKTADEWKASLGTAANVSPELKILVDILAQLQQLNSNSMCAMQQFYTAASGGATIQNDALVGKTVLNVYQDGTLLNTGDWSFVSATGTITLSNPPDAGIQMLIQYN